MNSPTLISFEDAPFEIIDGDRGKNYPKQNEFSADGHCLFLSAANVTRGGFEFSECQFITEQKDGMLRKGKLQRDDIVLTTRGTIGNVAHFRASVPYERLRINSGMVILRCNVEKISPAYLYHFLRSPSFHGQVNSLRSGVAQPQLPIRDMKRIKLLLPPLPAQQRIASILSAYDDLIENNRRRIQLLEQSARLLYKEWFVHLRFPGYEHVKIKDGVPEGWERQPLSKFCTDIRESVAPKTLSSDTAYIGLEHIPRRSITLSEWGVAAEIDSDKFKFTEGDILFGKIRPYFHKVGFALVDGIASSDAIVIRPTEPEFYYYALFLLSSDEFVALASKTVREGSKMPRADWKFLLKSNFKTPPATLLSLFSDSVGPICSQLRNLALHNKKLTKARDLLLPRLMNGESPI